MRKKRLLIGLALIFSAQALTFVAWPSSVSGTSILGDEHPKSKREALRNYRREHELARKLPVTWALTTFPGDDKTARTLLMTLFEDYKGAELTAEEFRVMEWTITVLGRVAGQSNLAFSFMKEAVTEDYWKRYRPWKVADPVFEEAANYQCQRAAIRGIGLSDRPETISFLDGLRTMYPMGSSQLRELASCMLTAFHEADRIKEEGFIKFRNTGYLSMSDYRAWKETPHGQEIEKWYEWTQLSEPAAKLLQENKDQKAFFENELCQAKTIGETERIRAEMNEAHERFLQKWRDLEDAQWKAWTNQMAATALKAPIATTNQVPAGKAEADARAKKLEEDRLKIWREHDQEMSALKLKFFDAKTSEERAKIFAELSASKDRYASNWEALWKAEFKTRTHENATNSGTLLRSHPPSYYSGRSNAVDAISAFRHRPPPE